jgi:hypothetical protein
MRRKSALAADLQVQPASRSCSRFTTQYESQQGQRCIQASRLSRISLNNFRQPLTKDLLLAEVIAAAELAGM